jgi:hypothetical protein
MPLGEVSDTGAGPDGLPAPDTANHGLSLHDTAKGVRCRSANEYQVRTSAHLVAGEPERGG